MEFWCLSEHYKIGFPDLGKIGFPDPHLEWICTYLICVADLAEVLMQDLDHTSHPLSKTGLNKIDCNSFRKFTDTGLRTTLLQDVS